MPFTTRFREYDNDYKESCFQIWVLHGRPSIGELAQIIPVYQDGRKPGIDLLSHWKMDNDWNTRADEIDVKAIEKVEEELVLAKKDLFKKQYQAAGEIADKAKEHIEQEGFDSSASAVQAYFKATEEQRILSGLSEFMQKVGQMTNDELKKAIADKVTRYSGGEVIDANVKEGDGEENEN